MWKVVEKLRQTGVTIILTTHYIEEAEAIADRVAVINQGEIVVVEDKSAAFCKSSSRKRRSTNLISAEEGKGKGKEEGRGLRYKKYEAK